MIHLILDAGPWLMWLRPQRRRLRGATARPLVFLGVYGRNEFSQESAGPWPLKAVRRRLRNRLCVAAEGTLQWNTGTPRLRQLLASGQLEVSTGAKNQARWTLLCFVFKFKAPHPLEFLAILKQPQYWKIQSLWPLRCFSLQVTAECPGS